MLTKDVKTKLISEHKTRASDSGSTEVQVALLSERIRILTEHASTHKKDHSSKTGLMKLVGQRKRLLAHLKREDQGRYEKLIKKLKLRK